MQLGHTRLYVPDIPATRKFYEAAFGLTTRFLHEVAITASCRPSARRQRLQPQPDAAARQELACCHPHGALL